MKMTTKEIVQELEDCLLGLEMYSDWLDQLTYRSRIKLLCFKLMRPSTSALRARERKLAKDTLILVSELIPECHMFLPRQERACLESPADSGHCSAYTSEPYQT